MIALFLSTVSSVRRSFKPQF